MCKTTLTVLLCVVIGGAGPAQGRIYEYGFSGSLEAPGRAVGDIDGDGYGDLAVAVPDSRTVVIYSGAWGNVISTLDHQVSGNNLPGARCQMDEHLHRQRFDTLGTAISTDHVLIRGYTPVANEKAFLFSNIHVPASPERCSCARAQGA